MNAGGLCLRLFIVLAAVLGMLGLLSSGTGRSSQALHLALSSSERILNKVLRPGLAAGGIAEDVMARHRNAADAPRSRLAIRTAPRVHPACKWPASVKSAPGQHSATTSPRAVKAAAVFPSSGLGEKPSPVKTATESEPVPPLSRSCSFGASSPSFPEGSLPQMSGYLPVANSPSKMFFTYYEATEPTRPLEDTPIVLWLNGGPGCSSMIGGFYGCGPWHITSDDGILRPNEGAWSKSYGLLFVDNPVGTGFSIATSDDAVPKNQEECAQDLYAALYFLYEQQPTFRDRPLILAGESYAGKYIPSLAHHIMQEKQKAAEEGDAPPPFRVLGLAIGNGFTHPRTQVQVHAEVSLGLGMIDETMKRTVEERAAAVVELIDKAEWVEAHKQRTALCEWLETVSGTPTLLDVRRTAKYHALENGTEYLALFLNRPDVKEALNVDPSAEWQSCKPKYRALMAQDTMKSVKWQVEELLAAEWPVLLFQGQYDAKDGVPSNERWMREMEWEGNAAFWATERQLWRAEGRVAGYWRAAGALTHVAVLRAGHQVATDQPVASREMMERWVDSLLEGDSFAKAWPKQEESEAASSGSSWSIGGWFERLLGTPRSA